MISEWEWGNRWLYKGGDVLDVNVPLKSKLPHDVCVDPRGLPYITAELSWWSTSFVELIDFSLGFVWRRLKLEALTDKEPGQLEMDTEEEEKEEGQDGVEEGLPASQPQPTTSQVLLEEEDLTIEEYISD